VSLAVGPRGNLIWRLRNTESGRKMNESFQGDVLAEENESGKAWSLLLLFALVTPAVALSLAHRPEVVWVVVLLGTIALITCAMAWSGFQYRFLRDGVEVRTLGFRLKSIPKESIVNYEIKPWPFICGRGIRGIGSRRAYVWSNQVVHIKTTAGDVFLGHKQPAQIVRDLDLVTGGMKHS
jgi:hypothetical protein